MKAAALITSREWRILRQEVLERDGRACTYCHCIENNICVDHIIPLSRGGSNDLNNLTSCCRKCNSSKRNRTPEEWLRKETPPSHSYQRYERFDVKPTKHISYEILKDIKIRLRKKGLSLKQFCEEFGLSKYTYKFMKRGMSQKVSYRCIDKIYTKLITAYDKLISDDYITLKDCGYEI